jgi:hypothetical protein
MSLMRPWVKPSLDEVSDLVEAESGGELQMRDETFYPNDSPISG